jgi:ribonuclease III
MQDFSNYQQFAKDSLGIEFSDINLFVTALTHRSYVNEHRKSASEHNERLEFLGDAVLELVVTEFLYANFNEPEGVLTNWRSALVRTESIGRAAKKVGYGELIRLSKGEKRGTDRARLQILANSFEAVIGAIYLDKGYDVAKKFINDNLIVTLEEILQQGTWLDPKSRLQELSQSVENCTPIYRVITEEGPDHEKIFKVGVYIGKELRGQGMGPSKQNAQVEAAKQALKTYK